MRAYWLGDETAEGKLADAQRAADLRRLRWLDPEWHLSIDVPIIDVARHLLARETAKLDEAFTSALELHRRYRGRADRVAERRGWLSIPLAGLTVWARNIGVDP
jgi:hypothetical protein